MKIIWDSNESNAPLPAIEEMPTIFEDNIQEDYENQPAPPYQGGDGFGNYN